MNLKEYLKIFKISNLDFSKSLGISNVSLSRYISGDRLPERKILENRSDDESNTILKRYDIYMDKTKPVLDYYSKKKVLNVIDGMGTIEQVSSNIALKIKKDFKVD